MRSWNSQAHTDADFGVEDEVVFSVDDVARFRGRVKRVDCDGTPNAERVVYTCLGLRELAKDVTVRDPDYGFPRVVFNAPEDDDDYDADRAEMTVGEMIAWLFDEHDSALRAVGAIGEAPATGYVSAELDALDVVPTKIVLDSTDFDAGLVELLRRQRGHRVLADPDTRTFHFERVADLPAKTITYNSTDRPLSALLRPSTAGRATAVRIVGPRRPITRTVTLSGGGLEKHWDPGDEADWTWAKCFDTDLAETYGRVFRRFRISDASKRRMAHALPEPTGLGDGHPARGPQVYRRAVDGAWAPVPADFDLEDGVLLLAQPATTGDQYAEGEAECADDLALVYAYLGDPLSARAPAAGYEGTAYTEPENPVEVVRRIYDEAFTRPEQESAYADLAAELLAATRDIVYAGTVRLAALDWSLSNLGHRLDLAAQDDDGEPVDTGFESLGAVVLGAAYHLGRGRMDLELTTDLSDFVALRPPGLRELATQARRNERYRSLHGSPGAATPGAGNDGEIGSDATARGVYSLFRYGDSQADRVTGHVDLEPGPGVTIDRQVDELHNGFKIAADTGRWFAFTCAISTGDESGPWTKALAVPDVDTTSTGAGEIELPAGRVTAIRAVFATNITAGSITLTPRKAGSADSRDDGEIDNWTEYDVPAGEECELSSGACSARVDGWDFELSDGDTLGLVAEASADFEADAPVTLYARLYVEPSAT
ncbi:MAG: hypothetical protein R6V58_16875 [Planctomycetota bacterium]